MPTLAVLYTIIISENNVQGSTESIPNPATNHDDESQNHMFLLFT